MHKTNWWYGLVLPVCLLVIWFLGGYLGKINSQLIPPVSDVWSSFVQLIGDTTLIKHIGISLSRILWGFLAATVVALPLGVFLGWQTRFQIWINPMLQFLRQVPPVALVPLFIMWFGIGEESKVALIFYASFFPIFLNTQLGVAQISQQYWEVAALYQFSVAKTLMKLVLPGSAAAIITGLRLGMGMCWRSLVAAEMLAASSGLGYLISRARSLVRLDELFVGVIVIGVIGIVVDQLFMFAERMLPWNKQHKERKEYAANSSQAQPHQ